MQELEEDNNVPVSAEDIQFVQQVEVNTNKGQELSEGDDGTMPAIEFVGKTEVILQNIFEYLHGSDLKNCRLVCKKWKYVCQGTFKKRMTVVFRDTAYARDPIIQALGDFRCSRNFVSEFPNTEFAFDSFYFQYRYGLLKERYDLDFIQLYGEHVRYLTAVLDRRNRRVPLDHLLELLNIFEYVPNMESLSLRVTFADKEVVEREEKFETSSVDYLKNLRMYFSIVGDVTPANEQKKLITNVVAEIIKSAKNLRCIETSLCPAKLEALLLFGKESLKHLKDLRLTDWKCFENDICQSLDILCKKSSNGDLILESFSIHFSFRRCEDQDVVRVLQSLIRFLISQKNHLKSLKLSFPGYDVSGVPVDYNFNSGDSENRIPSFPKMVKLEELDLSNSHASLQALFQTRENWTELFPRLKKFELSYLLDFQESMFPRLIENLSGTCQTVTEVTLSIKRHLPEVMFRFPLFDKNAFPTLYDFVREKFPKLEMLKFYHQELNTVFSSHNKQIEDIVSYRPEEMTRATRDALLVRNQCVQVFNTDDEFDDSGDSDSPSSYSDDASDEDEDDNNVEVVDYDEYSDDEVDHEYSASELSEFSDHIEEEESDNDEKAQFSESDEDRPGDSFVLTLRDLTDAMPVTKDILLQGLVNCNTEFLPSFQFTIIKSKEQKDGVFYFRISANEPLSLFLRKNTDFSSGKCVLNYYSRKAHFKESK